MNTRLFMECLTGVRPDLQVFLPLQSIKILSTLLKVHEGHRWGILYWHAFVCLFHVQERLSNISYLQIVTEQICPAILMDYPNGNGYSQQDNVNFNVSGTFMDWYVENKGGITLLMHPSSP